MKALMGATALLALMGSGCAAARYVPTQSDPPTTTAKVTVETVAPKPACEGPVFAWPDDGGNLPCDVQPPTRFDIQYPGSDGIEAEHFQEDCDWMGGTLVWEGDGSGMFVCQDVDY